ncbi:MAG: aminopeptidase [Ardenticatenia bacterium]|nr:aminopeptidase [Ardenticatenia bacterium]
MWREVAERAVYGLGVRAGELVQVRDHSGRWDVVTEMLLAVERAGATPLPELTPPAYLKRLLAEAPISYLLNWDEYRSCWMAEVNRVLVLQGAGLDVETVDPDALDAWSSAVQRLTGLEEERRLPYMLVAVPTSERAQNLGMSLERLERYVLPALLVGVEELRAVLDRLLAVVAGARLLTICSGNGLELHLDRGQRRWLADDGCIDEGDRLEGAITSNLPAGALYTTVLEHRTEGQVFIPRAAGAEEVILTFRAGEVVRVEARRGGDVLQELLARHAGDCRRVGHVGIGINPALKHPIGWTVVDEHVYGALFLSLGENRYMGGKNESTLNLDFALPGATLLADGRPVVAGGRLLH